MNTNVRFSNVNPAPSSVPRHRSFVPSTANEPTRITPAEGLQNNYPNPTAAVIPTTQVGVAASDLGGEISHVGYALRNHDLLASLLSGAGGINPWDNLVDSAAAAVLRTAAVIEQDCGPRSFDHESFRAELVRRLQAQENNGVNDRGRALEIVEFVYSSECGLGNDPSERAYWVDQLYRSAERRFLRQLAARPTTKTAGCHPAAWNGAWHALECFSLLPSALTPLP